jgi:hypothetical protein
MEIWIGCYGLNQVREQTDVGIERSLFLLQLALEDFR